MKGLYKFSKIIKELRLQNEWSQDYVAKQLGITYQSYQAYENGIGIPSLENFIKLADLFDVSLDYLVGRKEY